MIERIIVGDLYVNCYIYFTGRKECFLIDPGGDEQAIIKRLAALNMAPHALVFTHGHLDHIAAALKLYEYFLSQENKLPIAVHKADGFYFGKNAEEKHRNVFALMGGEALFESIFRGVPKVSLFLEEGEIIPGSDLTVIHTPGHTKGSVCLYNENKKILFTGDTLFCEGIGRSDLPGGDARALEASILKKLYTLPPETRIFPGHGPQSTLEREMNYNPFIRLNNAS
ncbi:MAG: MBL fold metallo-hydrolase [Spirochaetales bacterium]|jgi:glyoxylase-like metal-dependent hydrolase (beta-lactamase superfamily II)|nr:MBL fold metallo-hydrolase [Spirochaetales bacterium]